MNFLFPPQCFSCKECWEFFCQNCINKLKKRRNCEINSKYLDKIYAIYEYETNNNLKKYIKDIKYKSFYWKISSITKTLAETLEEKFPNQDLILIPVPLHWIRKFKRWFNQSEIIAKNILQNDKTKNVKMLKLLKRIRNTPHQASLDKKWRLINLKNAFEINKIKNIDSKTPLILVDDITTTWETLENCAIELRKHYKNPIFWLVIASDKKWINLV